MCKRSIATIHRTTWLASYDRMRVRNRSYATYGISIYSSPSSANRTNDSSNDNHSICNNDRNVSPLVGEKLRQSKSSELGISSAEPDDAHSRPHLRVTLRGAADDETDEQDNVSAYNEPTSTEEI